MFVSGKGIPAVKEVVEVQEYGNQYRNRLLVQNRIGPDLMYKGY